MNGDAGKQLYGEIDPISDSCREDHVPIESSVVENISMEADSSVKLEAPTINTTEAYTGPDMSSTVTVHIDSDDSSQDPPSGAEDSTMMATKTAACERVGSCSPVAIVGSGPSSEHSDEPLSQNPSIDVTDHASQPPQEDIKDANAPTANDDSDASKPSLSKEEIKELLNQRIEYFFSR